MSLYARETRFWSNVNKSGPIPTSRPDLGPCWIWTAGRTSEGYGQFKWKQEPIWSTLAHRISYYLIVGPIPEGLEIDHLCRVRTCLNPAHLEPVTAQENQLRSESASGLSARKTHCPQGHPYDCINSRGNRCCRRCMREQARRYRKSKKQAVA
jgi:hypothetical protein